ncbi:MAG: hypothetical protein IJG30_01130, partial [Synergistaceae bacterium]|nr:hypothetical protein [Synergistaceae bacterium]
YLYFSFKTDNEKIKIILFAFLFFIDKEVIEHNKFYDNIFLIFRRDLITQIFLSQIHVKEKIKLSNFCRRIVNEQNKRSTRKKRNSRKIQMES